MKRELIALAVFFFPFIAAIANPPKMATVARMDIVANASASSLTGGAAVAGGGTVSRMTWLPQNEQAGSYVATWPIRHFGWSEAAMRFVPTADGTVTIDLLGQWEWSDADGAIYQKEVLWDSLTATGAHLPNGSFETLNNGVPVGWSNPWNGPVVLEADPPPVDGAWAASVWHDRRLQTTLTVTGGVPVTIRAFVRARIPDGFIDNPRITNPESPAHQAARHFMRGINFGNVFEAEAGTDWGGGPITAADLDAVRAEGFDHVRLPVRWDAHTGPAPDYVISNAFFAHVDAVVTGLLARQVGVLLNVHHFDAFFINPPAWTNKLYAIWEQLARHYTGYPHRLAFEILNEPHQQATTEFMNDLYAYLLPRLRALQPDRTIFVGTGFWNSIGELPALRLPADDDNLIVTVHGYEPFLFTHQGATWSGSAVLTTNIIYPGPPPTPAVPHPAAATEPWVLTWFEAYNHQPTESNPSSSNAFETALQGARDWAVYYGRPVHVGEFGAYSTADHASRARYYREMCAAMDRLGLGWASWDWKAGFYYWDRTANAPGPGLRNAFFPTPSLMLYNSPRRLTSDLAVGKVVAIQTAGQPDGPWTGVSTQSLAQPQLEWAIPTDEPAAVFRLIWHKP